MFALVTTLEEVRNTDVELLSFVQILAREILRAEEWNELGIHPQSWIGTEVRSDLLCLILKDLSSSCPKRMVVSQCQVDGLIECDTRCVLCPTCPHQQKEHCRCGAGSTIPKGVPKPHKGRDQSMWATTIRIQREYLKLLILALIHGQRQSSAVRVVLLLSLD